MKIRVIRMRYGETRLNDIFLLDDDLKQKDSNYFKTDAGIYMRSLTGQRVAPYKFDLDDIVRVILFDPTP